MLYVSILLKLLNNNLYLLFCYNIKYKMLFYKTCIHWAKELIIYTVYTVIILLIKFCFFFNHNLFSLVPFK